MRELFLVAVVGALGCDAVVETDELSNVSAQAGVPPGPDEDGAFVYDEEPNGRFVLGATLDVAPYTRAESDEYFSVSTSATRRGVPQRVSFTGAASLTSTGTDGTFRGTDRRFNGLTFTEGQLKITLTVAGGDTNITHYALDVQHGGAPPVRLCADAIPLAGVIDKTGKHTASPGRITLACEDGAGFKCGVWGYPAGSPGSEFFGAHQACVQTVTANYCAEGESATRVGTTIRFYDNVGVHQIPDDAEMHAITQAEWPPSTEDFYFETAFTGNHDEAVCLAKLRWPVATSPCAMVVPDCPDGSVDPLIDPHGALFFVASKYNQLRLERWKKMVDGQIVDRVATVRGYFNPADQAIKQPWDGYVYEGHDGVLLRVPPSSAPAHFEVSMFMNLATQDRFVARSDDPRFADTAEFARDFEGYVFRDQSSFLRPLRLYERFGAAPNLVEYVSTTEEPAAMAVHGYQPALDPSGNAVIGFIAIAP